MVYLCHCIFGFSDYLYPINVETAEPIWPKFCFRNLHDPRKGLWVKKKYFWNSTNLNRTNHDLEKDKIIRLKKRWSKAKIVTRKGGAKSLESLVIYKAAIYVCKYVMCMDKDFWCFRTISLSIMLFSKKV